MEVGMKRLGLARLLLLGAGFFACASAAHAANLRDISVVPEPGVMLIVGTGLLLAARRLQQSS